jgi:hypothetical protein
MEKQFDAQALTKVTSVMVRASEVAKQIRKSDAYPALVGGIAGGIAGALMAALIAGRRPPPQSSPISEGGSKNGGSWTAREVLQLLAIVASIAKQVQAWYKEQRKT